MNDSKQALFDLMANRQVELIISGEYGEVDAVLKVGMTSSDLKEVASTIGAQDWETAIDELMEKYQEVKVR